MLKALLPPERFLLQSRSSAMFAMGLQELAASEAEMLQDWEMVLQLYAWLGSLKKRKENNHERDYHVVFQAKNASSNSDLRKAVIAHGSLRKLARERSTACWGNSGTSLTVALGHLPGQKKPQLSSRGLGWGPESEQCLIPKLLGGWGRLCDLGWPLQFKVLALSCKYSLAWWCISYFSFWFQLQTLSGSIPSLLNWNL